MSLDRWLQFMSNHPILFGILAVLTFLFFTVESKRSGKKVSPNALGMLVNTQDAKIIDIRPKKKFETGYIQGSRNIPFIELKDHLEELRAIDTPIVIVCDMGMQAGAAIQLLNKPNAVRLEGGIGGWQAAGMPLVGAVNSHTTNLSKKGKTIEGKAKAR